MQKLPPLTPTQRERIQRLESALRNAAHKGDLRFAEELASDLKPILRATGRETRWQQAKMWVCESAMEAGNVEYAISGLIGLRSKTDPSTRMYIETSALLAICYIRKRDTKTAERFIAETIAGKNNIKSAERRREFVKAMNDRFKEEALLAGLQGMGDEDLDPDALDASAGRAIQTLTDDELYLELGRSVPGEALSVLQKVQLATRKQLSGRELLFLKSAEVERQQREIGKTLLGSMKRVLWRALCDPDSDVYKMWFTDGIKALLNNKYLACAIVAALLSQKIGLQALAVYLTAIILKTGLEVFCDHFKPEQVMDLR